MNLEQRLAELESAADRVERLAALAEAEYWAHTLDLSLDQALERDDGLEALYLWLLARGYEEAPEAKPDDSPTFYLVVWINAYVQHRRDTRERAPDQVVEKERELARRYPLKRRADGTWDYTSRMVGMALRDGWDIV